MAEITLDLIWRQGAQILLELKNIRADTRELKTRMTALEGAFGLLLTQLATFNGRFDRFESRIEHLEQVSE